MNWKRIWNLFCWDGKQSKTKIKSHPRAAMWFFHLRFLGIPQGCNRTFQNEGWQGGAQKFQRVLNLAALHRHLYEVLVYLGVGGGLIFWQGLKSVFGYTPGTPWHNYIYTSKRSMVFPCEGALLKPCRFSKKSCKVT